jgi:hypothetical protein
MDSSLIWLAREIYLASFFGQFLQALHATKLLQMLRF